MRRDTLEEAGHAQGAQGWLRSSLQTTRGTDQLYRLLQQYVQKPAFLQKLTAARTSAGQEAAPLAAVHESSGVSSAIAAVGHGQHEDVMQASFWDSAPGSDEVIYAVSSFL